MWKNLTHVLSAGLLHWHLLSWSPQPFHRQFWLSTFTPSFFKGIACWWCMSLIRPLFLTKTFCYTVCVLVYVREAWYGYRHIHAQWLPNVFFWHENKQWVFYPFFATIYYFLLVQCFAIFLIFAIYVFFVVAFYSTSIKMWCLWDFFTESPTYLLLKNWLLSLEIYVMPVLQRQGIVFINLFLTTVIQKLASLECMHACIVSLSVQLPHLEIVYIYAEVMSSSMFYLWGACQLLISIWCCGLWWY